VFSTDNSLPSITGRQPVTAPPRSTPTALQAYSQSIEAIELEAEAELPPRHFATLMSIRRRRCEYKERIAEQATARRAQSDARQAA
jgi:hypothetical protein